MLLGNAKLMFFIFIWYLVIWAGTLASLGNVKSYLLDGRYAVPL